MIKIASYDTNGQLGDKQKRTILVQDIKEMNINILCMQKTQRKQDLMENHGDGIFINSVRFGDDKDFGVTIFIPNKLKHNIKSYLRTCGRVMIIRLKNMGQYKDVSIINVYSPTDTYSNYDLYAHYQEEIGRCVTLQSQRARGRVRNAQD